MFPRIECVNKNNTEGLRLFFHYGGTKNAVAEFELFSIGKGYRKPAKAVIVNICKFKTGHNVMLGMARQQIINILGKDFKSSKTKDGEILKYYTDDLNTEVLKNYGGVAYFIICRFKGGKLVQYNFGFEYP